MQERRVIRADSPTRAELEAQGWFVVARSWGAGLVISEQSRGRLQKLLNQAQPYVVRELISTDVGDVLTLDQETVNDYPGDVATAHEAVTADGAMPSATHRGWGAFSKQGELIAMTFANIASDVTETDFTVVHREWRGRGLGSAVKAACVLALASEGHVNFRTGGSAENPASIAANKAVGYELDEEWLTLVIEGSPAYHIEN